MSLDCELREAFEFLYRAELDGALVEHEYDHVFVGTHEGAPAPDPSEVAEWSGLDGRAAARVGAGPSLSRWMKSPSRRTRRGVAAQVSRAPESKRGRGPRTDDKKVKRGKKWREQGRKGSSRRHSRAEHSFDHRERPPARPARPLREGGQKQKGAGGGSQKQ